MAARPTTVQNTAIRTAIDNERLGNDTLYTYRTLDTMQRNGWITRPNTYTYRITPEAAIAIGHYTLADRYRNEHLLATDPKAQRQAAVIDHALTLGIRAIANVGATETVTISVEALAALLEVARPMAYAA